MHRHAHDLRMPLCHADSKQDIRELALPVALSFIARIQSFEFLEFDTLRRSHAVAEWANGHEAHIISPFSSRWILCGTEY